MSRPDADRTDSDRPDPERPDRIVIVGPGRVGSAFVRAAAAAGIPADVVRRGSTGPLATPHPGVPIVVCARADDLDGVIRATAPENRADLVFVQNGMLLPLLRAHGLADATQGLVYFAATSREGPVEPGAPSLFWGPHAAAVVGMLAAGGIPAREVPDRAEFSREIAIKLAWNAIFGLLGERYGETVGETLTHRRPLVDALAAELAPVLTAALRVDDPGTSVPVDLLVDRLVAYSSRIPTFRAAVKELPWRNGFLVAAARAQGAATPLHDRLLGETGHA
jgi:ketopantoate reductase